MKRLLKRIIPGSVRNLIVSVRTRRHLTSPYVARQAIGEVDDICRGRIDDVVSSPDNAFIKRVPDAGVIKDFHITMHNGVKVCANGYYGSDILNMLIENKGVHEPQEERSFETIIRCLPEECTMLELGAYWGFYSLSLLEVQPKAICHLVEPNLENLTSGKINFELNGRKGHFLLAMVDEHPAVKPCVISVDSYCEEKSIDHLHVLHADIQGAELAMLKGAKDMLARHQVDYVFISTHSNELHETCSAELVKHEYVIIASADLEETFSYDGLIVAKRASLDEPKELEISSKTGPAKRWSES